MYMDEHRFKQWNPMMLLALLCNRQCCFDLVQMFWPQVVLLRATLYLGGRSGEKGYQTYLVFCVQHGPKSRGNQI